jgi:hypothetical protein
MFQLLNTNPIWPPLCTSKWMVVGPLHLVYMLWVFNKNPIWPPMQKFDLVNNKLIQLTKLSTNCYVCLKYPIWPPVAIFGSTNNKFTYICKLTNLYTICDVCQKCQIYVCYGNDKYLIVYMTNKCQFIGTISVAGKWILLKLINIIWPGIFLFWNVKMTLNNVCLLLLFTYWH